MQIASDTHAKGKYWYKITREFCPICADYTSEVRERQQIPKPDKREDRVTEIIDRHCYCVYKL